MGGRVDPITVSVIQHRLEAIVQEMGEAMLRTSSVNRSHQSDIGGATQGAYNAAATEIWQEGIRHTDGRISTRRDGRGFSFEDPYGHLLEVMTVPGTGSSPKSLRIESRTTGARGAGAGRVGAWGTGVRWTTAGGWPTVRISA